MKILLIGRPIQDGSWDVKHVAPEALPACIGVRRRRADFEERAVDVEDDSADAHVREFHKRG
jgi:hypothetical protein